MLLTKASREILSYRRVKRDSDRQTAIWAREGFEEIGEDGGMLWEIYRGFREGQIILAARIAPDGMSVWVKIGNPVRRSRSNRPVALPSQEIEE
jgi:hypothetical protein